MARYCCAWKPLEVIGSHCVTDVPWCAMHLWSVQLLSNQLLKLLRTRTKCAERCRTAFRLCCINLHRTSSIQQQIILSEWRFCTRCWTLSAASVTPVYSSKQHGLEISAESRLTLRTSEASYSSNRLETRWNEYHQPALKLSVRCQILFNFQWMTRTLTCHSHHPFTVAILGWLKKHAEILQNPAASAWHRNISQRNDHSTRLGTLMCEWPGVC